MAAKDCRPNTTCDQCAAPIYRAPFLLRLNAGKFCSRACRNRAHPPAQEPLEVLFWRKVDRSGGPMACWLWRGALTGCGYGNFAVRRNATPAHRVAYTLAIGPIPAGLHLDHLCRNTGCVNPAHLEAVTPKENVNRGRSESQVLHRAGHCRRGHAFAEHGALTRNGKRRCRACEAIRAADHRSEGSA